MVIAASVVLLFASSCMGSLIISLKAEADWTAPLGSIRVTCNTSSSQGGELSYEWSASGGSINGTGPVVNWTAPEEVGMYDITVVVTDGQGGEDTASLALIASNGPPPVIEDLIVTAVGHPYLKELINWYKIGETYDCNIECIALNTTPGELVYEWSCTDGEISGEGSLITWTAPDTECYVTVTVKVFDGVGNWVRESVDFQVVCPSCQRW